MERVNGTVVDDGAVMREHHAENGGHAAEGLLTTPERRSVRERKPSLALTEATMSTHGRKRRETEDGRDAGVMSAHAAKRASLEEEIERRRKLTLGIVEDVELAWAEHGATPRRGAEAATEAWVQCDREACGKWRRVPRCVADALGAEDRFVCEDGRDGRFNACERAQESTDADIDARLDESLAADAEARATAKKDIIGERRAVQRVRTGARVYGCGYRRAFG